MTFLPLDLMSPSHNNCDYFGTVHSLFLGFAKISLRNENTATHPNIEMKKKLLHF